MTVGTGIAVGIGLICVTFIITILIGARLANKKYIQQNALAEKLLQKKNKI